MNDNSTCAECGEYCDPRFVGSEWGESRDASGTLRAVHQWCVEVWSKSQRAANTPPTTEPRHATEA